MMQAAEAEGALRSADACAAAQAALARAEAEVRVQAKRAALGRDFDDAGRLALEARRLAERCALGARTARARAEARAREGLDALAGAVARAAALARHVPADDPAEAELRQARIALAEGRDSLGRGEYERAEDAARRGGERTAAAVAGAARFIDAVRADPRRAIWRRWVRETIRDSRRSRRPAILVDKLRRQLLLVRGDEDVATYDVDLGIAGIASKRHAGDEATPEGTYRVTEVRGPGQTRYYKALMLDYPNAEDRARFQRLQRAGDVPRGQGIGGLIEIHGKGGRGQDWTQGCVALENADMDDLVRRVGVGTRVTIVGTIPDGAIP